MPHHCFQPTLGETAAMPSTRTKLFFIRIRRALLLLSAIGLSGASARAQATPDTTSRLSRVEVFSAYSFWAPHAEIGTTAFLPNRVGFLVGGNYALTSRYGISAEGQRQIQDNNNGMYSFAAGPSARHTFTAERVTFFVHAEGGAAYLTGPNLNGFGGYSYFYNSAHWGPMLMVGGGFDYETPFLHGALQLRLMQADFQYIHENFGPVQLTTGGDLGISGARLSSGLVLHLDRLHNHR